MLTQARLEKLPRGALRIEYEPEVDILTIYLQDTETALSNSDEVGTGIILNYAENGGLASVEILDASERYPPGELAAASVDELIDLKTASRLAAIAPVTLRTQAGKGKLWALRLGGQWLTTRERLQQYVESRSRKAKA
ncbi:MAG: DUF2283 domain-containing protein [Chloroflexi bacterium]|nr:DUF2283 domain-containing protein [Chloroflexota bacterium]